MIINSTQRGAAGEWSKHLLKPDDNETIRVVEIRGLAARDLHGALIEMDAQRLGTRIKNSLFCVVMRPPNGFAAKETDFRYAMKRIQEIYPEIKGQPYAIVEHMKDGGLHWHVTWSRVKNGRAIDLAFTRNRLTELAGEMFERIGLEAPEGIKNFKSDRPSRASEKNLPRAAAQQAKRMGFDAEQIRETVTEAWSATNTIPGFIGRMEDVGLYLAQGDRRGFVLIHHTGAVFSLSKFSGAKAKDIRARLGSPDQYRTVQQVKDWIEAAKKQTPDHEKEVALEAMRESKTAALITKLTEKQSRSITRRVERERSTLEQKHKEEWRAFGKKWGWRNGGLNAFVLKVIPAWNRAVEEKRRAEMLQIRQRQRRALDRLNRAHIAKQQNLVSVRNLLVEQMHRQRLAIGEFIHTLLIDPAHKYRDEIQRQADLAASIKNHEMAEKGPALNTSKEDFGQVATKIAVNQARRQDVFTGRKGPWFEPKH